MTSSDFDELEEFFTKLKENEESVELDQSSINKIIQLLEKFKGSDKLLEEFRKVFANGDSNDVDNEDVPEESSQSFRVNLTLIFNSWNNFRVGASVRVLQQTQNLMQNPARRIPPVNPEPEQNTTTSSDSSK